LPTVTRPSKGSTSAQYQCLRRASAKIFRENPELLWFLGAPGYGNIAAAFKTYTFFMKGVIRHPQLLER
jgi:hypothetical protein